MKTRPAAFDPKQDTGNAVILTSRQFEEVRMSELLIQHGEWVVVCDGAKALVMENAGDAKSPSLKTIKVFEQKDLPTHELGEDVPVRVVSSIGEFRSGVEQTDWHDQAERAFLAHLVQHLDGAIATGKTKSLIVVAPPRALGKIRAAYSHAVRGAVRAELDKDLVKHPVREIEKLLTRA
jgi:protein required for attachment to host cells